MPSADFKAYALREGAIDTFARRFLRQVFMPAHMPGEIERIEATFSPGGVSASVRPRTEEGHLIRPEDVFYLDPDYPRQMNLFEYLPEAKLIREVERLLGVHASQEFWRQALSKGATLSALCAKRLGRKN